MKLADRIAWQTEIVNQRCSGCGGPLKRIEKEDHAGVCWHCRRDEK